MSWNTRFCAIFGAKMFIRAILYAFSISAHTFLVYSQTNLTPPPLSTLRKSIMRRRGAMVWLVEHARDEAIKPLIPEQLCTTPWAALPPIGITRLSQFRHSPHITGSSYPALEFKRKRSWLGLEQLTAGPGCDAAMFPQPSLPSLARPSRPRWGRKGLEGRRRGEAGGQGGRRGRWRESQGEEGKVGCGGSGAGGREQFPVCSIFKLAAAHASAKVLITLFKSISYNNLRICRVWEVNLYCCGSLYLDLRVGLLE